MGKQTDRIDEKNKRNMVDKIMCKKDFLQYRKNGIYEYWTNFGGLNHFVQDYDGEYEIFDGPYNPYDPILSGINHGGFKERPWLYDYFYTKEEMRDMKINTIFA